MSAASEPLYRLQAIEIQLDSVRHALHAAEQRLKGDPAVQVAVKSVDRLEGERRDVQVKLRALEAQAEDAAAKVDRLTKTLYGGSIHDSREMASIEAEIGHAKAQQAGLEDDEIDLMERLELVDSKLQQESAALVELRQSREQSLGSLATDAEELKRSVTDLQTKRDQARSAIEPALLARYERLQQRTGHAVSKVEGGICQWCRVQLPSQDAQHARGSAIATCPNCGRILYAE